MSGLWTGSHIGFDRNIVAVIVVLGIGLSASSVATAITFVEATDLPESPTADLGEIDAGSNLFTGSISSEVSGFALSQTTFSGDRLDRFEFTVPIDMLVTDVNVLISDYHEDHLSLLGAARGFDNGVAFTNISFSNSGTFDQPFVFIPGTLGPGEYAFLFVTQAPNNVAVPVGATIAFDWQLEIVAESTATIPVPAALPAGLALLAAASLRRRRSSDAS